MLPPRPQLSAPSPSLTVQVSLGPRLSGRLKVVVHRFHAYARVVSSITGTHVAVQPCIHVIKASLQLILCVPLAVHPRDKAATEWCYRWFPLLIQDLASLMLVDSGRCNINHCLKTLLKVSHSSWHCLGARCPGE